MSKIITPLVETRIELQQDIRPNLKTLSTIYATLQGSPDIFEVITTPRFMQERQLPPYPQRTIREKEDRQFDKFLEI